jgi:polyisoprenoid-binding protein YceI
VPEEEDQMVRRLAAGVSLAMIALAVPATAAADKLTLKLLQNYSRATFKSDAPLETFVGNTAGTGIEGTMAVDPAKPAEAVATVRVDMSQVSTGVAKRDEDMRGKNYLDTAAAEANRWVVFELKGVEVAGPLEPGKETSARVKGVLTVKGKPVETVADARVTYIKLTPEQVEAQKRFGFTSDNIKVRARLGTTFTNHGMQIPQLLFLKVANELQLEADLTFVRQ